MNLTTSTFAAGLLAITLQAGDAAQAATPASIAASASVDGNYIDTADG